MSEDLIKRSDAIAEICKVRTPDVVSHQYAELFINAVCRAPSAPSIDIVRCKECKWAKANGTYQWCGRLDSTARITADDYCSYGEHKDKCKECWYWSEFHKRCENKCGCQFKPYGECKESE